MQEPVVSICCLVYNHEPFLRECFEGFVMQKTTFPIEILVHDDASTDHSADIIREYTAKYPDLFKPIYQTENQYSKGVKVSATFQFPRAKGKYIALCEGDDYWTDPYKLQKQVDFLESHPEYVMCSHVVDVYKQEEGVFEQRGATEQQEYDIHTLINEEWRFDPLSVVFKRRNLDLVRYSRYKQSKDVTLFYMLLSSGKGFYMDESMAVYRIHTSGVWSGASPMKRWLADYKYREAIYDVERTDLAANYMLKHWDERKFWMIGRKDLLKRPQILLKSFCCIGRHYGLLFSLNLFVKRFF